MQDEWYNTVKKRLATFPSPAGMSLTKLFLGGNKMIIPAQGEFVGRCDIPAARTGISLTFFTVYQREMVA
jgi:hypothetical protein